MESGWRALAETVIVQAVKDYRIAHKVLRRHPNHDKAKVLLSDAESFLHSEWFETLSNLDPVIMIKKLKEEVR